MASKQEPPRVRAAYPAVALVHAEGGDVGAVHTAHLAHPGGGGLFTISCS